MKTAKGRGRVVRGLATLGALALGLTGVAFAAAPASATPNVPNLPDAPYTLHITKYAQPNPPLDLPNDGTQQDIPAGVVPLEGVQYEVAEVTGVDLTTAAGWQLTEQLTVNSQGEVVDGSGQVYPTGTAVNLPPTNASGATSYTDNGNPAVFLVTETSAGNNPVPGLAAPFLVTLPFPQDNNWLTDVYVYPKNTVASAPTKTVSDAGSFGLGQSVNWTIDSTVPNLADGDSLSSFVVKDALDSRLAPPASGDVTVTFKDMNGNDVPLDSSDYAVAVSGQNVSVTFTPDGLAVLADHQGGTVSTQIPTVVNGVGDGTIQNTPVVNINDTDYSGTPAQTTWGSLSLKKVDEADPSNTLKGAEFQVFTSEADAKALSNPVSVKGNTTFTSDADGIVAIAGLKSQNDGTGDNLTYYIVETQAPVGYNIAPTFAQADGGHPVTILPGSTANAQITVADPQVPPFILPLTGSTGTALFVGGGIALMALAFGAALLVYRRKRHAVIEQQ